MAYVVQLPPESTAEARLAIRTTFSTGNSLLVMYTERHTKTTPQIKDVQLFQSCPQWRFYYHNPIGTHTYMHTHKHTQLPDMPSWIL